ncbi:uncharacterized protein CANTADRAFT_88634 [Suhomyces tanzawaensis NRRL Y-17324]|uniref:Mitochondrial group I intron splicing factor CCM1 n=1 Tax=Suhomyces tanzawaensis NRRL Y-17324 TaxID=984487 RepID=A0A1E4SMH6_9ASCO|nr:uncharacterized protein CANTADRAFT_88634 [Suhomyces tanzawaensis NRRL Y-17324]ODV80713.1 hypothetical protein CANTADRAFT_88634 [Suhomyces tanzawaensis NRRL Y-17324]
MYDVALTTTDGCGPSTTPSHAPASALDKAHRALLANTSHHWHKYSKPEVQLEPSVRNWLVMVQNHRHHKRLPAVPRPSMPTPFKPDRLLEPVVFHQLLALTYMANWPSYPEEYVQARCHELASYLASMAKRLGKPPPDVDVTPFFLETLTEAAGIPQSAINSTENDPKYISISTHTNSVLHQSLQTFKAISKSRFNSRYSVDTDLVAWILSLASPTVTTSCEKLRNLTNIPPFVLSDILLRTPMSLNELELQHDIWNQFKKPIITAYVDKPTFLKSIINNMIFYTITQSPSTLPHFIRDTFEFLNSKESGCSISLLGVDYLNELVWDVASTALIKVNVPSSTMKYIIRSQEVLVACMNRGDKAKAKTYQQLTLKSHMGIALAINTMSNVKAAQLMTVAEKRFFTGEKSVPNKDMLAYNITKVYLSKEPEELVENFNSYAVDYSHSTALWLSFIKRLQQMGLLTENRSIKILNELTKIKHKVIVSKDIVSLLIKPIRGLNGLHAFISALRDIDKDILKAHASTILPKYMTMLYRNYGARNITQNYYPWDPQPSKQALGKFKGFDSVEDYARYLYNHCIRNKSPRVIGAMLQGEAMSKPESVYDLYQKELINKGLVPDKTCLTALIRASMKPSKTDSCILWGNFYAPQVAIHEFAIHVKQDSNDSTSSIVPDDTLWQQYIRMLSKYSYSFELSEIIQWWEKLGFRPKHTTLMLLLGALPLDHSNRHIRHVHKVRSDNERMGIEAKDKEWNWPTVEELEKYKASQ